MEDWMNIMVAYVNCLVQDCGISSANADHHE